MSTISTVNPATELAKTLIQRYDANKDGSLSTDEFATFLSGLLGSVKGTAQASPGAASTVATASPPSLFAASPPPRLRVGLMGGFDDGKMNDETHRTFKYQIGRILQYYPATPEGLRQALPEIQQLVPDAAIIGTHGDKIDFGRYEDPKAGLIGVIDVLVGAAVGGRNWAWQPVE